MKETKTAVVSWSWLYWNKNLDLSGNNSPGCITGISQIEQSSVAVQEKRIYDLKKKNQELEKFKFVLDYKIKELKKQIEPKEKEIRQMKDQISEVRVTFNHHFRWCQSNSNLLQNYRDTRYYEF